MGSAAAARGAFACSVKQKSPASSTFHLQSICTKRVHLLLQKHTFLLPHLCGENTDLPFCSSLEAAVMEPVRALAGGAGSGTEPWGAEGRRAWQLQPGGLELTPVHWDQPALRKQLLGSTSHLLMLSSNLGTDFNLSRQFFSP